MSTYRAFGNTIIFQQNFSNFRGGTFPNFPLEAPTLTENDAETGPQLHNYYSYATAVVHLYPLELQFLDNLFILTFHFNLSLYCTNGNFRSKNFSQISHKGGNCD